MHRTRRARYPFDTARIFIAFVFLALLAASPLGAANTETGAAAPADAKSMSLNRLADIIENDKSRAQLVKELREAAASQAQGKQTAHGKAAAAGGAATGKHKALEHAPRAGKAGLASVRERANASKQRVSFARQFAQTTSRWSASVGARVVATWHLIASMNKKKGPGPKFDAKAFINAAIAFALVAASTVIAFLILRLFASTLFSAVGRLASNAERGFGGFVRRTSAIVLGILVDVAVVVLACAAGYAAGLYGFGATGSIGTRESLFINAFVLIELTKVAIRAVFAARYEHLRLLHIPGDIAGWWSIRLRWFVGIVGYGLLVAVPIVNAQLSFFAGAVVTFLLMAGAYLYALSVIFRNRKLLTQRMLTMAQSASIAFFSVLLRIMAWLWAPLAVVYFTVLFVSSQMDPQGALPFMLSATAQTLVAAAVALGLSGLLSKAIGSRITFSYNVRQRLPLLEVRVNSYVPYALKLVRVILLLAFAMVVVNAWKLVDMAGWLASDAGLHAVGVFGRVCLVLLGAVLFWLVSASMIENRLSPNTRHGPPSARQQTLLALFSNVLAIATITMTVMIALSQIGVNIGPLLAGASVFGLAIGFGAQTLVHDIISGVFIQLENAINTGDVITAAGLTGTAERLTIRSVSIRDIDGAYHIVPFSAASVVSNYMHEWAYFRTEYRIAYHEDVDNAVYYLREAFAELKTDPVAGANILEDMTVPGVTAFGDSAVSIRIMIKTKPGTQWGVGRAFNRLVKMHFDRAGIEIPFPHRTLYFGEDSDGKAPPANLRIIDADAPDSTPTHKLKKRRRGDDSAPEETGDAPG